MKCIHHKKYTTCYLCKDIELIKKIKKNKIDNLCIKLNYVELSNC